MDHLDLRSLRVFEAVAAQASFAEAGRQLNLPRALVSRLIAALETELGVQLFRRTTRKVVLTDQGHTLARRMSPHLAGLRNSIAAVHAKTLNMEGTVRVTVSHAFGRAALLPLLTRFGQKYPHITLDVYLADGITDLLDEQIDVAVRLGPLPDSTLIARRLGELSVSLVASPTLLSADHPRSIAALSALPAIAFRVPGSGGIYGWQLHRRRETVTLAPKAVVLTLNSIEAVVDAVRAGVGVAAVPNFLIEQDLVRGRLKRVLADYALPSIAVHLCFVERELQPARTRALVDFLVKHAQWS